MTTKEIKKTAKMDTKVFFNVMNICNIHYCLWGYSYIYGS